MPWYSKLKCDDSVRGRSLLILTELRSPVIIYLNLIWLYAKEVQNIKALIAVDPDSSWHLRVTITWKSAVQNKSFGKYKDEQW